MAEKKPHETKEKPKTAEVECENTEVPEETVLKTEETVLKSEYDALNDTYLRLLAEFTNYKKRTEKEKLMIYSDATAYVVKNLLTVKDTLEIAAAAESKDEEYKKGVILTLNSLNTAFSALKIEEISPLGEPFNPEEHNAVMTEENPDFEDNTVSAVLQKGYKTGDKIIRPAMVKVANA